MEAALRMEALQEPMSATAQQEKLLEKLNLGSLSNWTPQNATAARNLVLALHDIFTLEGNEFGCTSAIEHEISITNSEPQLLEEVHASLQDMLDARVICPSQSHGAMRWYW